jgi:phytoene synthase
VSDRDLAAAGISDPALRASYTRCRQLNAAHGRTYYLATRLLPPAKRPYVHALYGFARYADDIVDDLDPALSTSDKAALLSALGDRFRAGGGDDPVLPAVLDTATRWEIPQQHFTDFLASMRMDLTVTSYPAYADLLRYMHGSAAVIGLQLLPVLGHPTVPRSVVEPYAADLGIAFQLTNFIRDVGEDLHRGRVYLPQEDLDRFGVDRERLAGGVVDGPVRRLLEHEVARARAAYRAAAPGIRLLDQTSRDCVRTAFLLYRAILDEVERVDYRVLDRRVTVGPARRAAVAAPGYVRAVRTRRGVTGRGRADRATPTTTA